MFKSKSKLNHELIKEEEADVAVIGSGAGGAVVAKELAELGYKVVIIEEGRYFTKEKDFNIKPMEAFQKLYRQSGYHLTKGTPMGLLPVGCTVGGSTTVFSGTCLRLPSRVLKRWQLQHGLTELDENELALIYKTIEEYLFIKRADPEVAGENARLFLETARDKLGLSGGWLPRCAKDCEGYGACPYGCPSGSKQSMDVSYIPGALAAGATLFTRCRAESILINNGEAAGVEALFLDAEEDNQPRKLLVRSKVVALAGGSIYTPLLLLNQKICNSSGLVGKNLSMHPGVGCVAEMDKHIGNPRGIPQSSYVDEFEAEGIIFEGGTVAPGVHSLSLPFTGKRHREHMNNYPMTASFGGMISDTDSEGSVSPSSRDKYKPLIKYDFKGRDVDKGKFAVQVIAQVWFAAGAKRVYTSIRGYNELTSPKDLARLESTNLKPADFTATRAFHPMGTCPMGSDPKYSVVKHTGETWDLKNLYIVDGSIVPTPLGVNPMLTIAALSMRASGFIDERLGSR